MSKHGRTFRWKNGLMDENLIDGTLMPTHKYLVSMQKVNIQCRPTVYSTCVQRLSVQTIQVYTVQVSLCVLLNHRLMRPACPSQQDTAQCFSFFWLEVTLKNRSVEICLLAVVPLSHRVESMEGGGVGRWQERRWSKKKKWRWDSSRKSSWIPSWPEVKNRL